MIVCIAEKPSVAKDIAEVLGAKQRNDGYYEGNGYQITWTFGHLCTLKEPHDYKEQWKYWKLEDLPIIPLYFPTTAVVTPKWMTGMVNPKRWGNSTLWIENWRAK